MALSRGTHENKHLQAAFDLCGKDSFEFKVLEEAPLRRQFEVEQEYLNRLNPFGVNGYNMERSTHSAVRPEHPIHKVCVDCEREFDTFSRRAKYCPDCSAQHREAYRKAHPFPWEDDTDYEEIDYVPSSELFDDWYGDKEDADSIFDRRCLWVSDDD